MTDRTFELRPPKSGQNGIIHVRNVIARTTRVIVQAPRGDANLPRELQHASDAHALKTGLIRQIPVGRCVHRDGRSDVTASSPTTFASAGEAVNAKGARLGLGESHFSMSNNNYGPGTLAAGSTLTGWQPGYGPGTTLMGWAVRQDGTTLMGRAVRQAVLRDGGTAQGTVLRDGGTAQGTKVVREGGAAQGTKVVREGAAQGTTVVRDGGATQGTTVVRDGGMALVVPWVVRDGYGPGSTLGSTLRGSLPGSTWVVR